MAYTDSETNGVRAIEGEFYTEHFVVRGVVTCAEDRLSDHLNSSTTTFELCPTLVRRCRGGARVNICGGSTYLAKDRVLFVIPLHEPVPVETREIPDALLMVRQTCWAGLGPFSVLGSVHVDASVDPRLSFRTLQQRRFLPFTDVCVTHPDGTTQHHAAVLVNRAHVELFSVLPKPAGGGIAPR